MIVKAHFPKIEKKFLIKIRLENLTVRENLKNNGQKIFEIITDEEDLK